MIVTGSRAAIQNASALFPAAVGPQIDPNRQRRPNRRSISSHVSCTMVARP